MVEACSCLQFRGRLSPLEVFKKAALARMYGVGYGIRSFPGTQWNLLSSAGDFWLAFQKSSANIEIARGKSFEVAEKYLEDCKFAGFNDQNDSISSGDEEIKISIELLLSTNLPAYVGKALPVICPRLGLFENVILKGSDEVYTYSVKTEEKVCSGTLKPLKLTL